ncbi:SPW repeat domain-containing protein [Nonomuraea sp. SBT364]|uniref:SPW repeat domain-containing protein n=1 Tax=Nonomuraea sp. SBT364 TaxID=1580530 RepID=UPI00066CFF29|nr:SPW repeat protein [Nonomuraea sp. SBT364]
MKAKLGVSALVLLFLAGLWLVAAPFVVGYQPSGAAYTDATVNDLWVGGGLAGLSFIALVVYAADALRELTRGRHVGSPTVDRTA